MILSLFVLIAWVTIIIFSVIPKGLSKMENAIMFFCITIMVLNIFTIVGLNLKLVEKNNKPDMYIGLLINRNIIVPLCILTFINLLTYFKERLKKISVTVMTLFILEFDELLTVWTGLKVYTGWNIYLDVISLLVLIAFSTFLMKWLKKIE